MAPPAGRRTRQQDAPGLETFTILTTEPNALCAPIHNRMPVILAPDDWGGWLGSVENRKELLRSFPAERMECWPVGKEVGNVRNQGPQLVEPVEIADSPQRFTSYDAGMRS